tara:strand:+ start:801 stop:1025 length:225 start_codon:yes stop_codon:yes gene_type:complete
VLSLIFSTSSTLEDIPIAINIDTIIESEISVTKTDFRTLKRNLTIAFLYLEKNKITFFIQIISFTSIPLFILVL